MIMFMNPQSQCQ